MTDKEKLEAIIAEIKRRISSINNREHKIPADKVAVIQLEAVLSLYDSLKEESVSEDVEEAAKHYLYSNILYDDVYVGNPTEKDCIEMFRAGAKWQKEQMMKDAMEIAITGDCALIFPKKIGENKEKIKVIIIKEG